MRTGSQPPPDFGRLALALDPRLDAGDRAAGQLLTDALLDVADHHQVLPRGDRRDDSLAVGAGGASGAVHVVIDALRNVEVDHVLDAGDVDAASGDVRRDEDAMRAGAEVVER